MFSDVIVFLLIGLKGLLIFVAVVFFISGLDDFFVDIYHAIRSLYRRLFVLPKYSPLTERKLLSRPEQAVAVMVPAWDESQVIGRMLEHALQTLNYANYHFFVGTYPNDPDTRREVERVRERFGNVQRVICPKDGPTNKADCLNWIYQGIQVFEKEQGIHFDVFVMMDSEDIPHPLSLKLFNYLIPKKDMVQLPVLPLEVEWHRFSAGHYIDEFAENHSKDLPVRERLTGTIPSAGVGCAFSRRALDVTAERNQNRLFNVDSLTEDYDFGLRLSEFNLKQIFVRQAIERVTNRRSRWTGKSYQTKVKEVIATREYFPSIFRAAVRQKARWVLGIAFQGWTNLGWKGDLPNKYMLFRDRKALVTNYVNVLGYMVLFGVLALLISGRYFPDAYRYPSLIEYGSWLWYLIVADTFFLGWRISQRAFHVQRLYGWGQALLSIPRGVVGNFINFVAVLRATLLYARYLVTGKLISWDKTHHAFPSEAQLLAYRRRLGDLLLERRFVSVDLLDEALERQKREGGPLGAILVRMGAVDEEDLIQVLGLQLRLSTREIDPYQIPLEALEALPHSLAVRYSIFPLEIREGRLVVAISGLLTRSEITELEQELGRPLEPILSTRSDVAFAIRRGYERLEKSIEDLLGRRLVERGLITESQLERALKVQRHTYRSLGDVLLQEGMLSEARLQEAIDRYSAGPRGYLGEFLVRNNYIDGRQLDDALTLQVSHFEPLGFVLTQLEMISPEQLRQALAPELLKESAS